jgi:hypothetical protein
MLYSQLRVSGAERDFRYPSLDPKLANLHPSMLEAGKTAAKLKSNAG